MPRPKNNRFVNRPPLHREFKPTGIAARFLEKIILSIDEYEAIRLKDFQSMSQEESALEMGISRPTFTRLIESARKKIADFIVSGKSLRIDGGQIHFRENIIRCNSCGHMFIINIEEKVDICPSCGSDNLINHAGGFGHGQCCINQIKKGENNYAKQRQNRTRRKRPTNR
ncbi:MAG: DUF134 domain-containing protein [Bacteroidota bacterium]|nr:DUF134 domain-containing protein [Bacteroidota bacterium]